MRTKDNNFSKLNGTSNYTDFDSKLIYMASECISRLLGVIRFCTERIAPNTPELAGGYASNRIYYFDQLLLREDYIYKNYALLLHKLKYINKCHICLVCAGLFFNVNYLA